MTMALLLATAIPPLVVGAWISPGDSKATTPAMAQNARGASSRLKDCVSNVADGAFGDIGKATIFAPLDVGPALLYGTDASIIASGYHRNSAAIAKVIRAYTSRADEARAIIMATPAQYLLTCGETKEMGNYRRRAPDGLAAALERGDVPDWLEPDARLQTPSARLYRILR